MPPFLSVRRYWLSLAGVSFALILALTGIVWGGDILAAIDGDSDGFDDSIENYIGTNPSVACPATTSRGDEATDAWPPDFNDDRAVDLLDITEFRARYGFGSSDPNYSSRYDLNADGDSGVLDLAALRAYYEEVCTPSPTPTAAPTATPTPAAPTATPAPPPPGGWAFMETFDGAPSAPSQDLLPRTFDYVATHRTDPQTPDGTDGDGSYGTFPADHGADCSPPPNQHEVSTTHRSNSANPDPSFYICANHMMSAMGEVAGYSVSSFWPRQEFDFANGGVLEFETNINAPHDRMWWEVVITPREELQAGAAKDWLPIDETYPESRIVFEFQPRSTRRMEVGAGAVPPDGQIASESECGNPCWWGANHRHPGDPALTDRRIRRTHRIEIQDNQITWGVEEEDGTFDTLTMDIPGGLPFTRGIVMFKSHAYTPEKAGNNDIYTFHWDNIGFTGPVLPAYDVFESSEVIGRLDNPGSTDTQAISIPQIGQDLYLFGQIHHGLSGQVLLSINNGPNISIVPHTGAECRNGGWRSFLVPLNASQLHAGTNTFKWTVGPRPACAQGQWYPDGFSVKALEVQMTLGGNSASNLEQSSGQQLVLASITQGAEALSNFGCSVDQAPDPPGEFMFSQPEVDRAAMLLAMPGQSRVG
jgi:hypothetical protein